MGPQDDLNRWEAEGGGPLFQPEEVIPLLPEAHGHTLQALGLDPDRWFITLHVRETGCSGYDRTRALRNASIQAYLPMIELFLASGGQVVRLGEEGMTRLPKRPGLLDLAGMEPRLEWVDVYLLSQCRAFVGVNSGPSSVAQMFGVPCLLTNLAPISEPARFRNTLYVPKRYTWTATGERLRVEDMLEEPAVMTESPEVLARHGIEAVENTAPELLAAGRQLLEELEGARGDGSDARLQRRLASLFEAKGIPPGGRMGRDFLRELLRTGSVRPLEVVDAVDAVEVAGLAAQ